MVLIVGGAIVMVKLNFESKTKAMGIHFSGIGFSIVISELISQIILKNSTWHEARITSYNVCYTKLLRAHGRDDLCETAIRMLEELSYNFV